MCSKNLNRLEELFEEWFIVGRRLTDFAYTYAVPWHALRKALRSALKLDMPVKRGRALKGYYAVISTDPVMLICAACDPYLLVQSLKRVKTTYIFGIYPLGTYFLRLSPRQTTYLGPYTFAEALQSYPDVVKVEGYVKALREYEQQLQTRFNALLLKSDNPLMEEVRAIVAFDIATNEP